MRLSEFILSELDGILAEWESFATTIIPEKSSDQLALRNDAESILRTIALDMETPQSDLQQAEKSKGRGPRLTTDSAAETHSDSRIREGFNQVQMVSEYRALRASVIRLWMDSSPELDDSAFDQLIRFNEGIDQAIAESTTRFMEQVEKSRDFAVAVLAHDLRNPLNAVITSANCLRLEKEPDSALIDSLASMILESGMQMSKLVDTLLDFTRTRLGRPLVIKRELMDLRAILQQTRESMAAAYPGRSIRLDCSGSLQCAVDSTRVRQLFSNLIANAIQHGAETSPVALRAQIESGDIVVRVHNDGPPIPSSEIPKLFEFLPKNRHEDVAHKSEFRHLGIGLYITRKIVEAHSGTISVTSTQKDGTTFEVRLPCSAST